ncbi:MAG: hypothetical protein KY469_01195 [Actinobacteria bacterium]|nr:hypothetical protein [Actinomycetota bacterium]
MPDGAELVTGPDGPVHPDYGSFLDAHQGLDIHREIGALGIIRRGDQRLLVNAVRLRDRDEAARALAAMDPSSLPEWTPVPEVAPHTVAHLATVGTEGNGFTLLEVARATGRDLIVYAQLDHQPTVSDLTREALAAHIKIFPDVTPPAGTPQGGAPWLVVAGGAAGLVAVTLLVVGRLRRPRAQAAPPTPIDPGRIRVNW